MVYVMGFLPQLRVRYIICDKMAIAVDFAFYILLWKILTHRCV